MSHVTPASLSRSNGQGHQAALISVTFTGKAAAAVSVGTYSAWESTATLRLFRGAGCAWAPTGEDRGWGILCLHAHSLLPMQTTDRRQIASSLHAPTWWGGGA